MRNIIPADILAGGTINNHTFGSGSVKILYYNHHKDNSYWEDTFEIQGSLYNDYGIYAKLNSIPGQDSLYVDNYRPGVTGAKGVGINAGKKPQFTITFYDNSGRSITTGTFIITDTDGSPLK